MLQLTDTDKFLGQTLIEFYDNMKALERDVEKDGKQPVLVIMAIGDITHFFTHNKQNTMENVQQPSQENGAETNPTPGAEQTGTPGTPPEFGKDANAPGNDGDNQEPGPDETATELVPETNTDHAPDALLHGEQPNQPMPEPEAEAPDSNTSEANE